MTIRICLGLSTFFTLLSGAFAEIELMKMSFACFALAIIYFMLILGVEP